MSKELLPELPEMEWVAYDRANDCEVYAHTDYAIRAYGQACYEAGRKSVDMEQFREAVETALLMTSPSERKRSEWHGLLAIIDGEKA